MAATPRTLVIDVAPYLLDATVTFWSEALGADPQWPDDLDAYPYVVFERPRSVLGVVVQRVDGPPRYHLDLAAADVDAEADRLEAAGARRQERGRVRGREWWVLTDPAGNWLCVVPHLEHGAELAPRRHDRGYLNALFVDVPATDVDASVAFWSAALGAVVDGGDRYTALEGVRGPGGELIVEVQRVDAPARLHVDVVADDVEVEAERLVALGARRVHQIQDWWTLADPAGNLLCVVPS